ncbi:T9SS type A sorting domain-containing protein [Ancylomarina salipaludis]|nr:T9SS type A sorting domain-containing protein [Ancylomarina salipaludis]
MKKKYLLGTVGILALSAILIGNYTQPAGKEFCFGNFTPKEFWQKQFQEKKVKRMVGYSKANKPDMYGKYFKDITTKIGESESGYKMNYKTLELENARNNGSKLKSTKAALNFIQRGPANIGGRTRAIIVDPDDPNKNTWIAGSATGGIWRTTDGAENWTHLSDDLTNLSVNALVMANSDHSIIYAGTGESFPGGAGNMGNGIWKSVDRGANWTQLVNTATDEKFSYTNRLWVNPVNADIVIAATEYGIFKSKDGGENWNQVYESDPLLYGVDDLAAHPEEENIIYAGEGRKGILRTTDGGDTWELFSRGLAIGTRYEIAVSPVNKDIVYTSINISEAESTVFVSWDKATNWYRYKDEDSIEINENLLGGQGNYNNTIVAHPFIDSVVFVGGVNMWKLAINHTTTKIAPAIKAAYTVNTDFLSFVNFEGSHLGGGLNSEGGTNLLDSDWTSIEIRFGEGISQMAHRFIVPDQATSGVANSSYTYADYKEVPFQVWDITNNKQLMVSFRDQERDGSYNLYTRKGEGKEYGDLGREYIFINAVEYNADTPDNNIAKAGGHMYKSMYMIWPELKEGAIWEAENLPESKIIVEYGAIELAGGETISVADAYGNVGGANSYQQAFARGETKIEGLHPDHHNITIIPGEDNNFRIINGNDGGIGVSEDNGVTFKQKPNNYITTQFYGVAKNPEANEYMGGMQDNGTWQSAADEDASSSSNYYFRLGGDGFECLWHSKDPKKLLGSIYYNSIYKSLDGGNNWSAISGISYQDGPFITRLSASKWHPDVVFAIAKAGVYKSTDFGANWKLKRINSYWAGATSKHNVEVSLADPNIVWAGAAMVKDGEYKIHVSKDEGETFTAVNEYEEKDMRAYISGIATHPSEPSTAYLLFAVSKSPKILRTTDLGQSWEDISGFGTGEKSSNGFPDVVTHSLLVMPHAPNIIWAGTEIGLFESTDNGANWHAVISNMPPVSIYDMHIVGKQVIFATHGRGVWSVDVPEIDKVPEISEYKEVDNKVIKLDMDVKVNYDQLDVYLNGELNQVISSPDLGALNILFDVEEFGVYSSYVVGHIGQETFKSNVQELEVKDKTPVISSFEVLDDYKMNIQMDVTVPYDKLEVYLDNNLYETVNHSTLGTINIKVDVDEARVYETYAIGYIFDTSFQSDSKFAEMIPTGVETIHNEVDDFKIYPNPCRGEFRLQLNSSKQAYTLEIFNLMGRKVYVKKDENLGTNSIFINSLQNGVYIVRITSGNETFSSKLRVLK